MKILKKITIWLIAVIILIVIQGLILIYIYEKDIKSAAIQKLNTQINTPIKVGEIKLEYFEHFPFISLKFPNVTIYDSKPGHKGILLSAEEISLLFNIWDIYQENYKVKKLYVDGGVWTSNYDKNGISNFNILKQDETTSQKSSNFKISLEEIEFNNCSFSHIDLQSNQIIKTEIPSLTAKGNFQSDEFNLSLNSSLNVQLIYLNKLSVLKGKKVQINTSLNVDLKNDIYLFDQASVELEKMKMLFSGNINLKKKNIDITASGSDLNIVSFLSLLPSKYQSKFNGISSIGEMYFNLKINGRYDNVYTPNITLNTGFRNADITIDNDKIKNQKLNKLNFDLTYSNFSTSNINDDQVNIKNIKCLFNNRALAASIKIKDLNNPYLELSFKTKQSLTEIQKLWKVKNVDFKSGEIDIKLNLNALLSELKKDDNIKHIESKGEIQIVNTNLVPGKYGLELKNINGSFSFQRSDLKINDLNLNIGNSDFELKGYFRNLFSYILTVNEDLKIDAILKSNKIDLKELLASSANSTEEEPYKLKISDKISANVKLNVKSLYFDPFKAFDLTGEMTIEDQIINTDYLAFRSQKGLVFSKLNFNTKVKNNMPMIIELSLNKVDISNLFYEFNNFGLDIITDKNIRGIVSSNMKIDMIWDENLNSKLENFKAIGNILIENGELINFKPMLALAKYIDVNQLNNLKFSNLENNIEIKNSTINIPDMEVKSNALNLRLTGTHTFENKIDYHLQLLLSDFIKKKSKKLGDERFGEIEPDGNGNTNLYIRMYGDVNNPSFSLDKQVIKKKISEDFKNEKSEVKKILKEEFGSWFKKEKEFKESLNDESADWEKDLPQKNVQNNSVSSSAKTDSLPPKKNSKFNKLKEKLKEKPEDDE